MTSFLQLEFKDVALDFEGECTRVKFCIAQGSPCLTLGGLGLTKKLRGDLSVNIQRYQLQK